MHCYCCAAAAAAAVAAAAAAAAGFAYWYLQQMLAGSFALLEETYGFDSYDTNSLKMTAAAAAKKNSFMVLVFVFFFSLAHCFLELMALQADLAFWRRQTDPSGFFSVSIQTVSFLFCLLLTLLPYSVSFYILSPFISVSFYILSPFYSVSFLFSLRILSPFIFCLLLILSPFIFCLFQSVSFLFCLLFILSPLILCFLLSFVSLTCLFSEPSLLGIHIYIYIYCLLHERCPFLKLHAI